MSPAAEPAERRDLERLARARHVAPAYRGVDGRRRPAGDDALVGVLAALGEPVGSPADAAGALAERRRRLRRHPAPAVLVAWDGRLGPLPPALARHDPPLRLLLEGDDDGSPAGAQGDDDGSAARGPEGGGQLPHGVHRLVDEGARTRAVVLSAPSLAPSVRRRGGWGLFAPTYAVRDRRRRATGDLTALEGLGRLAAGRGAAQVATLPLLAEWSTADGAGPGQQPYAPLSRRWWNEGYLDLERLPELASREGAAALAAAQAALATLGSRRAGDGRGLADVAGAAAAARPALDVAAATLAAAGGRRRAAFEAYAAQRPELDRYARFRAAGEVAGPDLARWPARWQAGEVGAGELPAPAIARHRYAQFAMDDQLGDVAAGLRRVGCGLLLDLPVGCAAGGYDPWAHPAAFATGASVGAPPDAFFTKGQAWGFPPPHPDEERAAGYPMLRAVLAHHMAHATVLRVDHALGWARLWWVPTGLDPSQGAYVRYPTDELLAVACLEADRSGCALVGEDLGTVPPGLRPALRRHGVDRMRVAVFDLEGAPRRRLGPPGGTVAYVDTHDTATFAAFATGADVDQRARLGLGPSGEGAVEAKAARRALVDQVAARLVAAGRLDAGRWPDPGGLLGAVLDELGVSAADLVVVSVDDLLGELEPHNVPGTTSEHDNFARTLVSDLDELAADHHVGELLARLVAARRRVAGVERDPEG